MGPRVAAVLLGTAFVLLLGMMLALPHLGVPAPAFGWVVLVLFVLNGALCALAPRGSAASDLSVPLAALVAVLACSSMWGLLLGQLNAGSRSWAYRWCSRSASCAGWPPWPSPS